MPICVTRKYSPSQDLEVDKLNLKRTAWGTYDDEKTQAEFRRFTQRDIVTPVMGIAFGPGSTLYAVLNLTGVEAVGIVPYWLHVFNGMYGSGLALIDVYLLWRKAALDQRSAWFRSVFAFMQILTLLLVVGIDAAAVYAKCDEATDYYGRWINKRGEMNRAELEQQCIDIVNPYLLVATALGYHGLQNNPLITAFAITFHTGGWYLGYVIWGNNSNPLDNGESTRELLAKMVFYIVFGAAMIVLKFVRYRAFQDEFEQALMTEKERRLAARAAQEVDGMLGALVPQSALERLLSGDTVRDHQDEASVLFSDMVNFTGWSAQRTADQVVAMLNDVTTRLDEEAQGRGVVKIKTIGDAYWAAAGIPEERLEHAEVLCGFGTFVVKAYVDASESNGAWGRLEVRVGVASGPLEGGIYGTARLSYEVSGRTSELAGICERESLAGRVCVSSKTASLMGDTTNVELLRDVETEWGPERLWLLPEATASARTDAATYINETNRAGVAGRAASVSTASRRSAQIRDRRTRRRRGGGGGGGASNASAYSEGSQAFLQVDSEMRKKRVFLSQRAAQKYRHGGDASGTSQPLLPAPAEQSPAAYHQPAAAAAAAEEGTEMQAVGPQAGDNSAPVVIEDQDEAAADRIGARRFNWVLMHFDDEDREASFQQFVAKQHLPMRRACRFTLLASIIAISIGLIIEGPEARPGGIVCIVLAALLTAAATGLAMIEGNRHVDAVLLHIVGLLLVIGTWLFDTYSLFGNDINYVHTLVTVTLGFGITVWPVAVVIALNIVFFFCPVLVQSFNHYTSQANVTFLFLSFLMLGFLFVGQEKLFRRQFVEQEIARLATNMQRERNNEQRSLLEAIVPLHAVAPLTGWLRSGRSAARAVAETYVRLHVGFIHLLRSGGDDSDTSRWLFAAHDAVDDVLKQYVDYFDKVKTMGDTLMIAGPFSLNSLLTAPGDMDLMQSNMTQDSQFLTNQATAGQSTRGTEQQLITNNTTVESTVSAVGSMSSPKKPTSLAESGLKMLEAVSELKRNADVAFVCGFHTGTVMGAVLGTERLCYDVFGDTVNTASRTMTSLKSGGGLSGERSAGTYCAVSEDFGAAIELENDVPLVNVKMQPAPAKHVSAKGKDITVLAMLPLRDEQTAAQ